MGNYVIGVDVGTTGTKTVLLDVVKGIVAVASRESSLHSAYTGWAEADPAEWLRNVHETISEVLAASQISARDVVAVATTGMVPAVVAVNVAGHPVRSAILQNDARAVQEIAVLGAALKGIDLVSLTGSIISQQSVAPTAMWLAAMEPEIWEITANLVGSYDWVLMALGADPHVEQNWALESGLFTIDGVPCQAVFSAASLDKNYIPPVLAPGERAGSLSFAAAEATGLVEGTPLIVGGADHVLSAFAAGVDQDGDWLVKLGGAGDILVASRKPVVDSRLYLDAHPMPGLWLPNGCMATSGSLIRWFQKLVGGVDLRQLDDEAEARPPAQLLCLPYFLGEKSPLHDPDLRGAFAGFHLGSDRADMYRSVLESIAFGFRHHVEVFRDVGLELNRVMITNGGSKSTLWKQIHSEILGTEMYPVIDHPGASLGAALVAAVGVGALDTWSDARRFLSLGEPVLPDPEKCARYNEAYAEWRELGLALTPVSHSISRRTRS